MRPETSIFQKPLCDARCKICKHENVTEINADLLRNTSFKEILEKYSNKGTLFSKASVCRHSAKLKKRYPLVKEYIKKERAEKALSYEQWTDSLLGRAFKKISDQFDTMVLDISDLERLAKLKILLKNGDDSVGDNILEIFKKAQDKYDIVYDDKNSLFHTEPSHPLSRAIDVTETKPVESSSPEHSC